MWDPGTLVFTLCVEGMKSLGSCLRKHFSLIRLYWTGKVLLSYRGELDVHDLQADSQGCPQTILLNNKKTIRDDECIPQRGGGGGGPLPF